MVVGEKLVEKIMNFFLKVTGCHAGEMTVLFCLFIVVGAKEQESGL